MVGVLDPVYLGVNGLDGNAASWGRTHVPPQLHLYLQNSQNTLDELSVTDLSSHNTLA